MLFVTGWGVYFHLVSSASSKCNNTDQIQKPLHQEKKWPFVSNRFHWVFFGMIINPAPAKLMACHLKCSEILNKNDVFILSYPTTMLKKVIL